jgi:hypothetical protein
VSTTFLFRRRFSPLFIAASLVATAGLSAACGAPAGESDATDDDLTSKSGVQMNDVSILYPLATSQGELDNGYLSASDKGAGGTLLPSSLYTKATGAPLTPPTKPLPPGASPSLAYSTLKMVAFRVDPCFANVGPVTDDASCKNQIRIIFQGLSYANGVATAANSSATDGAVHAFYSLTRDELVALVGEISDLRKANGGTKDLGPVAVHPILAKQGLLGAEAKGLNAIVLKYAGEKNLTRFTTFLSQNLATKWTFEGFDVASNKTTPMVIPTLPNNSTSDMFFVGFGADFAGGFTPETNAKDDMQLLGNLANAQKATKAQQQAAVDAALRIENPDFHSPNTIDCASCHIAGPGIVITGAKLGLSVDGNANAFTADKKFVSAKDMKQTTPVDMKDGLNVHAFSYRDGNAMVSQRVINETAAIVTYLNGTVLAKK